MRSVPQYVRLAIFAALVTGGGVFFGLNGWLQAERTYDFASLLLAAMLTSAFAMRPSIAEDRGLMAPHFVVDFGALLLLGGNAALIVAATGIVTRWLVDPARVRPIRRALVNAASVLAATETAWLLYDAVANVTGSSWPAKAVPIAAAVIGYCVVKSLSADVIA